MNLVQLRKQYHKDICNKIIRISKTDSGITYPNFADVSSDISRRISWELVKILGCTNNSQIIKGQTIGSLFESITRDYLERSFSLLNHIRPGNWIYSTHTSISEFEQYDHLSYLEEVIRKDKKLEAAFKGGYIITPDIVIARTPITDDDVNSKSTIVERDDKVADLTPLRQKNRPHQIKILHASISCKWTIRSDRVQNTRTEAINLIGNRKGPLPHIVAVTAEPTPNRLASLALGTGDLDCVYHFALYELLESIENIGAADSMDEIRMMIDGKRLRDISDLPFDLAI
jgi:hypothetical protein